MSVPSSVELPSQELGGWRAMVLCGGMGKRMQPETQGRISKAELPIPLPGPDDSGEIPETVLGMLVRALHRSELVREVILLTSDTWLAPHTELARELGADMKWTCNARAMEATEMSSHHWAWRA